MRRFFVMPAGFWFRVDQTYVLLLATRVRSANVFERKRPELYPFAVVSTPHTGLRITHG